MKNHEHTHELNSHYTQLLGLTKPWIVTNTNLDTEKQTISIRVEVEDNEYLSCPKCNKKAKVYDHRKERRWRHLDTMQFTTTIIAKLPRVSCEKHGIHTVSAPWANERSGFTILFEYFAIDVLLATSNITRAMTILKLSWSQIHLIQKRAVEYGLLQRNIEDIKYVGIDEKSFLKGHRYVSLTTDIKNGRVLDVIEGRTKESAVELLNKSIPEEKRCFVQAGAMDMWKPFMSAWKEVIGSETPIVHGKFHVVGYLSKAVDLVRKSENRTFVADGNTALVGTKYLFLRNPDNWHEQEKQKFDILMKTELKVGKAWAIKESFREFYEYSIEYSAKKFFDRWYFRATHSRIKPIIKVAKTLKRHLDGLLSYCTHMITNAVTEGLNSKIQIIKASARGFRKFENYRIAILFHCGKLSLYPHKS